MPHLAAPERADPFEDEFPHYDRSGRRITLAEFARLADNPRYRFVRRTYVLAASEPHHAVQVSTIWEGMDPYGRQVDPTMFETMVFTLGNPVELGVLDELQRRHTDEGRAVRYHQALVDVVTALVDEPIVTELRWRGRRRDVKLFRGMTARRREHAKRALRGARRSVRLL